MIYLTCKKRTPRWRASLTVSGRFYASTATDAVPVRPGLMPRGGFVPKDNASIIVSIPLNVWFIVITLFLIAIALAFGLGWMMGR